MSDEFPMPEWTCPKCGGRVERPFVEYSIRQNEMICLRGAKEFFCGHRWKPRTVEISLPAAVDILADAIDRER